MTTEYRPAGELPVEPPYTDEERVTLARVNPVFGEVHDGQQTAFAAFDGDDGERRGLEIRPFYMNRRDRETDRDRRVGVWQLNEYDASGAQIGTARMERVPAAEGSHYYFNVRDQDTGRGRPASHAEATHFIKLLGGMADTRDRAIASGEYPLVQQQRTARRRGILPSLAGLLRVGRSV